MSKKQMTKRILSAAIVFCLVFCLSPVRAQDRLPMISDSAFWRMITTFSEEPGAFRYENLLSNETSYQRVIPSLLRMVRSQPRHEAVDPSKISAYIGVGPEQNFTYIAAVEPQIAFIVDIRQQNLLEHLVYKALFEIAGGRVEFVSLLFSRRTPAGLSGNMRADRLFQAYSEGTCDRQLLAETTERVIDRLTTQHGFALNETDRKGMQHIFDMFCSGGPQIDYGFVSNPTYLTAPSYADLMTATDGPGRNWSYLANDENFERIQNMQLNNLIVPVVGDFAGQTALRNVGQHLKRNGMVVTAFYISNVEQYLNVPQEASFRSNVATFPITPSSTIIRFTPPESTTLEPIRHFVNPSMFHLLENQAP